ncbi:hypothetical protein Dsin_021304 [Dipteronia sinensis]|uniref:non-specific serine/threonine protein kinase n=1 Tax=Dipteronia sinensis TaxID=43782 RepID=A0AAE0DYY7_9ROSI|nr:hypothetical protein Dsin_021304 [Dipteronia sinensis]
MNMERISRRFLMITMSVLVIISLLVHQTRGLNIEGQYLLDIKSKLVDKFNNLADWNSTDSTPCGWIAVTCNTLDYNDDPVVWSLDLNSMNLSGWLSPSIGGLVHLTSLDLSSNELSRNIPKKIGNCLSLEVLTLNNNRFEANIPKELGKLSCLRILNIYNNRLSGPIPEEIGNLASLSQLVAYSNNISGSLPAISWEP